MFTDPRGKLTLVESGAIPFEIARAYVLSELPSGVRRAGHACRTQHRFLVGISGRRDGDGRRRARLRADPAAAATRSTSRRSPGSRSRPTDDGVVILVFADGPHEPGDYVRDRAELRRPALSERRDERPGHPSTLSVRSARRRTARLIAWAASRAPARKPSHARERLQPQRDRVVVDRRADTAALELSAQRVPVRS